VRSEVSESVRV